MKAVLIPVKNPARGKTRLSELLSDDDRRRVSWAMLKDVSRAVAKAVNPDRVIVVTNFEPAVELARSFGWEVLVEESQVSESASVDWASRSLTERGITTVMRLPADIPLVTPSDIDDLLSTELNVPGALIVPSRDGKGTNTLIRTPADLFPSRFGPNSLALHQQEASRVGVRCMIVTNSRIGLDIDEPADVGAFLECGHGTETFDLLSQLGVNLD